MITTPPRLPTGQVARRIVALLRQEPRRMWQPKTIAMALGLKEPTVRKEVVRILERSDPPPIVALGGGWYRAFIDPGSLRSVEAPEPRLHAIQVGCTVPLNRGWGPPLREVPAWGPLGGRPVWTRDAANGQWLRDEVWLGRRVSVAVSPGTGGVQVSLRASSEPLRFCEFGEWATWAAGWLQGQGIVWSDPEVQNVEMNLDYRRLYMGRAHDLKLRAFTNAWAQLYQKDGTTLRTEIRMHSLEDERLNLQEALMLIQALASRPGPAPVGEEGPVGVYVAPPVDPAAPEVA